MNTFSIFMKVSGTVVGTSIFEKGISSLNKWILVINFRL